MVEGKRRCRVAAEMVQCPCDRCTGCARRDVSSMTYLHLDCRLSHPPPIVPLAPLRPMAQSRNDEEAALSAAEAYEYASGEEDESGDHTPNPLSPTTRLLGPAEVGAGGSTGNGGPPRHFTSRSHYHVSHGERLRGVANRIIFSRYYVLFYFVMMCLSLGTVVLSLVATRECTLG
jgi:hypothetical protein